ncbi:MAG: sugar transferase, partial [Clostridia bacterium]|nr:sugar transferase [Clostridia bacterium]
HVDLGIPAKASSNYSVENFAGKVVLTRGMKLVSPGEMLLKRLMDICGAVVGLLITGLVSVFVIPAIKIADPGPAFFSQVRVGKNGRRFRIYKFRSMYMDAEERKAELMSQNEMQGPMFKMENDPRIIKGIGDFIRKTSIDELPQFWNVLNGTMSLVGTRPPTVNEYEQYEMEHLKRVSIKPGITGMWQTSGRNEITDFEEVVRLDTEYITNWSLGLDIKLLFKTVMVVFKREGSK